MDKDDIELGKTYRDKLTGFEGKATAITEYLYSTTMVLLDAGLRNEHGLPVDPVWFDLPRMEAV